MSTLAQLMDERRAGISRRWIAKVRAALPTENRLDEKEVVDSFVQFLDEVIAALRQGAALAGTGQAIAQSHGAQRQVLRRHVAEVVREYGLLFDAVVEECPEPLPAAEYARLANALNRGAAEAIREYASLMALDLRRQAWEHFAFLAHEIRGPLQTAQLASALMRSGAPADKAMPTLDRALSQLGSAIEGAVIDARLRGVAAGASLRLEEVDLAAMLQQSIEDSAPDAEARRIAVRLQAQPGLRRQVDRRMLLSAISNLVRNAIKFTRSGGQIQVRGAAGRIEVEDQCGGLEEGHGDDIFQSFRQVSRDRTGFGLGLAIAKEAIEAHKGHVSVRNLPGTGCVFVIELPETAT